MKKYNSKQKKQNKKLNLHTQYLYPTT